MTIFAIDFLKVRSPQSDDDNAQMQVNTTAAATATVTSYTSKQHVQFHRAIHVLALTKLFKPLSRVQIFLSRKNLKGRKTVKIFKSP